MTKKKIPYGISNFQAIKDDNCYYVDKTKYLELLEGLNEKYLFFLRPRKFGKSLFISLLEYYYGIEHKDKFDKLFGEYYIGKNPTSKANSYYILRFDFSGILTSTNEETFRGFRKKVIDGVKYFNKVYQLFSKDELTEIVEEKTSNEILTSFFNAFNTSDDSKIYVLVDEYDHFTNELISFRLPEFKEIVSRNGYVRKFYEAIKEGTGRGIVDRFFATGVTPVTLDSLTSGFNIGSDLTLDFRLNEMLGFTDEEVKSMLDYYDVYNSEEMMSDLHKLYNGSLFSVRANQRMYNSNMVLYFLNQYLIENKYPDKLIDTNIASDYNKIKKIFYINNTIEHQQKLNEIITDEETTATITDKYSFERPFTPDDFVSLLFYNGMLTIKEAGISETKFQIPNYVIKEIYWSFFKDELTKKFDITLSDSDIRKSFEELAVYNNMERWITEIEKVLDLLSNRDYQNFDEKYIKMLFITLASLAPIYIIKSEAEIKGEYPDIMYLFRKPNKVNFQFLIELKYLKKSESKKLSKTMELAKGQVNRYLQKPEISELENLKAYAIVFVGKKGHFTFVDRSETL
ncbi:MAG: AAA family ATPase [Ignavibacteriaceae bacterium]|nr:AAA family ATPase [Ignavibacteriaceae bacterium]